MSGNLEDLFIMLRYSTLVVRVLQFYCRLIVLCALLCDLISDALWVFDKMFESI